MPAPWWDEDDREGFWVEITDRAVVGEDLWAPQFNEESRSYWSYDMVTWVREGDAVLHFRTDRAAFTDWSRAAGAAHPDHILWGAHGYASGRGPVDPYDRPAWLLPLDGPYPIDPPVTMAQLQRRESQIAAVISDSRRSTMVRSTFHSSSRVAGRCARFRPT